MLKRTTVVIFSICLIVLLAGCVVRGVNPEPSSLFMTWLIGQAQERLTEAFPEEQFWGLWDVIGVDEESEVISNRAKTFSEIDRWEFRFAAGEIFGQKTGAIEWLDGEWQEPQIVNDQVMEEAIISDAELADVRYDLD